MQVTGEMGGADIFQFAEEETPEPRETHLSQATSLVFKTLSLKKHYQGHVAKLAYL